MKEIIDIAMLDPQTEEARVLYAFLKVTTDDVFEQNTSYPFRLNDEEDSIKFSYSLVRNRASQKANISFYVRSFYLGATPGSSLYRNIGKIILLDAIESCVFMPGSKYLEKTTEKFTRKDDEVEESKMLASLQLGGKNFRNVGDKRVSFLLKDAGSEDLHDYFINSNMNDEQRYRLCQAILKAYDEQIYQKDILHCDIKLENMMVKEKKSGDFEVTFIDFEFALPLNGADFVTYSDFRGTPAYVSPQLVLQNNGVTINFKYTRADDLWALNTAFMVIWEQPLLLHQARYQDLSPFDRNYAIGVYFSEFPKLIRSDYYGKLITKAMVEDTSFPRPAAKLLDLGFRFEVSRRHAFPALRKAWEDACPRPVVNKSNQKHQKKLRRLEKDVRLIQDARYQDKLQPFVNEHLTKLERLKQKSKLTAMDMLKQRGWMAVFGQLLQGVDVPDPALLIKVDLPKQTGLKKVLSVLGLTHVTLRSFKGVLIGAGVILGIVAIAAAVLTALYFTGFAALALTILGGIKVGLMMGGTGLIGILGLASVLSVKYRNQPPAVETAKIEETAKSTPVEVASSTPVTMLRKLSIHSRERMPLPASEIETEKLPLQAPPAEVDSTPRMEAKRETKMRY